MSFLTRIFHSQRVQKYFRFPSPIATKLYILVAIVSCVFACASSAFHVINQHSHDTATTINAIAGSIAITTGGFAYIGVVLFLALCLFYRLATELTAGFNTFATWAPIASRQVLEAVRQKIALVAKIPGLATRLFKGCGRAFNWLVQRPQWWRGLTSKERYSVVFSVFFGFVYIGTFVAVFPLAAKLSAAAPKWLTMNGSVLMQTMLFDLVLGSIAMVPVSAFIAAIFVCLRRLCR